MAVIVKMRNLLEQEIPQTLEGAQMLERQKEWEKAAALYLALLKEMPGDLKIISRLIIIYRKLKDPKKEIGMIDKALKLLSSHHERRTKIDAGAAAISKKLNLLLGHVDKKGRALIISPEIEKLQKRKAGLEKKIK